jgi:hypothetical protein
MSIFSRAVEKAVEKYLSRKMEREKIILPDGFHPADQIRGAVNHWLTLPFGNSLITCKIRMLSAGEYPDVLLVERLAAVKKQPSFKDRMDLLNAQEEYCRKALVVPTFEEFERLVLGEDGKAREMRAECEKACRLADAHEDKRTREAAWQLLEPLRLAAGYFLPPNFMMAVACWCECLDVTGIKQVTPEKLVEAYILSTHYHNRASDNIQGCYTDHVRAEIDRLAILCYEEQEEKKKRPVRKKAV